jgi:hypothetical protein
LAVQSETPLLIGVDGGATEVKAHAIVVAADGLVPGAEQATFRYESVEGFAPLPMNDQLVERESGRVAPSALEHEQGERWIDGVARAIESVAASARRADVLVGMCMPGLKTRDGRGIDAMRNGPRMLEMLGRLEARLMHAGVVLSAPIARIASDGHACGHGEEASSAGAFRDVRNAYYVGGGTGLAECFKLDGRVIGLDELGGKIEKGWALKSSIRRSYEDHISVRGINARWVELGGDPSTKPESAWPRNLAAIQALSEAVVYLDEILRARIDALRRVGLPALERFVVGQRLGALLASPELASLRASAEGACPIEFCISTLRAAPAIGAARLALADADIAGYSGSVACASAANSSGETAHAD